MSEYRWYRPDDPGAPSIGDVVIAQTTYVTEALLDRSKWHRENDYADGVIAAWIGPIVGQLPPSENVHACFADGAFEVDCTPRSSPGRGYHATAVRWPTASELLAYQLASDLHAHQRAVESAVLDELAVHRLLQGDQP